MVDTKDLRGAFSKAARVEWVDAGVPSVLLEIAGRIREALEIEPRYLLIEAFPEERKLATVIVVNREEAPLRIASVRSDRSDLETRLEEIEAGRKYQLTVARDPNLRPGSYRGKVELLLEGTSRPNPQIPLTIIVKPKVYVNRDAVVFRRRLGGSVPPAVTVVVEKYKAPAFKVKNLACKLPFIGMKAIALPYEHDTAKYELTFTLAAEAWPAEPFQGAITFETNDQDYPRVTLPVRGPGREPKRTAAGGERQSNGGPL